MNKWMAILFLSLNVAVAQKTNFEKGFEAFESGDYKTSIEYYTLHLKKNNSLNGFYNRGLSFYYNKQYEAAISDFSSALALDSLDYESYYNRAIAFYEQKKYTLAIQDLEKSLEINPNYAESYNYLGLIEYDRQNFKKAIDYYNMAISMNDVEASFYYNRALSKQALKNYQEAEVDFKMALKNELTSKNYWGLAYMYHQQKLYEKAIELYENAIAIDSSNTTLIFNKGISYYESKQFKLAIKDFKKVISLKKEAIDALWYISLSHKALGNNKEALKYYNEVEAINPDYPYLNTINKNELQIKNAIAGKLIYKILLGIMVLIALVLAFKIFFRKEENVRKVN